MTRKETRDITAKLPEGIEIMVDRAPVDLGGLEWRLGLGIEDGYIVLTSEGTKEFAKRIHYTQNFILGEEFRVAGEPDGDIVLNINQEDLDPEDIDPYEVVKEQYCNIYPGAILREGSPLINQGYKVTKDFLNMTVEELREEIIGSFSLDYLEQTGFIEKSNWNE
tara:strand:- start:1664 stop:2158 length:495 start_codon:yes stop_codon:yes gene_type:complete